MRTSWKLAIAIALIAGGGGSLATAQLITGNTSAFGCGKIYTSDFSKGSLAGSFYPDGAGGTSCPGSPPDANGRGLAVGGKEIYYTELASTTTTLCPKGPCATDVIRVAPFGTQGSGGADTRSLPNPRAGSGIQDLTFSNGILYALTGYNTQAPVVYGMNFQNGNVLRGPVTIAQPGGTDLGVDGFAVLPNGNFLVNNGDTSCIYNEYDATTGALVGNTINVPGGPGLCTGVDTDGSFLYFLTDFNSITQTDFQGNLTGFNFFENNSGDELAIEDISLAHPTSTITDIADGSVFLGLRNSDDIGRYFDLRVDLYINSAAIPGASAITRCIGGLSNNRSLPKDILASFPSISAIALFPGDVISFLFYARLGTNPDDSNCDPIHGSSAVGVLLYYDSIGANSNIPMTIQPNPEQNYYLHSDGSVCPGSSNTGSTGVTTRFMDINAPLVAGTGKCAASPSLGPFSNNLWQSIGFWSLAPLP